MRLPCVPRWLVDGGHANWLLVRIVWLLRSPERHGHHVSLRVAARTWIGRLRSRASGWLTLRGVGLKLILQTSLFAICLNPSKDSRPRRTPGTACACPPSRASASGHLSVSPWIKFYLGPPGAILGLFSIRRVDFSLKLIIIGFFLINKITISKVFDNKKAKIKINRNHLYHYRGLTDC